MPPTLKHLNIVKTVNFTLSVFYHNLKKKKDRNTPEILLVLECLTDKVGDGDMSKGTGTQRVGSCFILPLRLKQEPLAGMGGKTSKTASTKQLSLDAEESR